jgi:hypothetical protein
MTGSSDQPASGRKARGIELEDYCLTMARIMRRRRQSLILIAIGAGACLGFLSLCIGSITTQIWGRPGIVTDVLAIAVGTFFGCVAALIVPVALDRKDLRIALPFVYVPTAALVAWYAWKIDPFGAAVPATVVLLALCAAAWIVLPVRFRPVRHGLCHECGYDLEGNPSGRCSECGFEWITFMHESRIPRPWSILGTTTLGSWLGATWPRRVLGLALFLLVVGFAIGRYTGPRFTAERFEMIHPGMTQGEVLDILGPADLVNFSESGGERWSYGPGLLDLDSTGYHIEFDGEAVQWAVSGSS